MPSANRNGETPLNKAIDALILTLASETQGFSTHDLAREFYADTGIDGEKLAKDNGFHSFEDFLNSDIMKKRVDTGIDRNTGRAVYIARFDHRFSHIQAEQNRSLRAKEQKQDKETTRNYISSAGTIGRKFYDDSPASYPNRNSRDDYVGARGQRQYANENNNYDRFDDRERNSRHHDDYDSQRYRDSYSNAPAMDRPQEPFNDIGLRRQPGNINDNAGSKFCAAPAVTKSRSTGFGVGFDAPERGDMRSSFSDAKNSHHFDHSADMHQNVAPKKTEETISPFKTYSRNARADNDFIPPLVPRSENIEERPTRRYEDSEGYMPASQHFSNPDKNFSSNDTQAQHSQRNFDDCAYRPARTPPPMVGKNVANIVWDEEEGDDLIDEVQDSSATKRLSAPTQLKKPAQKYGGDYDDVSDDEKARATKQQPKTQEWTRRDAAGEYTDEDASDSDDESSAEKNRDAEKSANTKNLTASSAFHAAAKGSATPIKSNHAQVLASNSSSESTVNEQPKKTSSANVERKETTSPKSFNRITNLTSVSAVSGPSSGVRVPASHGEKWLFELGRQEAEKASRKPQRQASASSSSENERDDVFRSVASTAKNPAVASASVSSTDSQPLRRPIPLKPSNSVAERSLTSSVINDGGNTPSNSTAAYPLRRTGSTVSVMSTLTARRWNCSITEEDLGKMAHLVDTIMQYNLPRAVLLEDLVTVMELIDPRFSSLEQLSGYEYTEFLSKFCKKIEVFGRPGNFHLLWHETDAQN